MENNDIHIRVASEDDAEEILAIYAPYVIKTAITFEYEVPTLKEFRGRTAIPYRNIRIWWQNRTGKSSAMHMLVHFMTAQPTNGPWRLPFM